jgi:hypothetical protein
VLPQAFSYRLRLRSGQMVRVDINVWPKVKREGECVVIEGGQMQGMVFLGGLGDGRYLIRRFAAEAAGLPYEELEP